MLKQVYRLLIFIHVNAVHTLYLATSSGLWLGLRLSALMLVIRLCIAHIILRTAHINIQAYTIYS